MADGEIVINTKINTSNTNKELKKLKNNIQETGTAVEQYSERSTAALNKELKKLELEAKLKGQNVDAQQKYNIVLKNYINLMTESNGLIQAGSDIERQRYRQLQAARHEMEAQQKAQKNIAGTLSQVAAVATTTIAATKKVLEGIRDVTESYKVQSKAEEALTVAAKNNPYINDEAVEGLKRFASELQGVTNYGDEFTLQFITQLTAAGRTQDQIQRIIKASANIAAAGTMSFDSAVKNLNKTFSGLAGELGESIPQIKELTVEQLKAGDAIDVVAKQYEGMAESMADVRIQAENAQGDLKEAIGELTAPAANAWDAFWLSFYNKGIEIINSINDKIDSMTFNRDIVPEVEAVALSGGVGTLTDEALEGTLAYYEKINEKSINITEEQKAQMRLRLSEKQLSKYLLSNEQELVYKMLKHEKQKRQELKVAQEEQTKAAEQQAEAEAKVNEVLTEQQLLDQKASKLKEDSEAGIDRQLKALEAQATIDGTSIDVRKELAVYEKAYVDLLSNSGGLITENNELSKKYLDTIRDLEEQVKALDKAEQDEQKTKKDAEDAARKREEETNKIKELGKTDSILENYNEEQAALAESRRYWEELEVQEGEKHAEELKAIDDEILQNKRELHDAIAQQVVDYTNQINSIVKQSTQLMLKAAELTAQSDLQENEKQYRQGEKNEEQYNKKKIEIQRKAANEQYRIRMFEWSSSLLVATANIAEGVTKSIAQGFPIGLINGAILAAAGGVQLASIIASKPVKPAFAKGGIVPGNSYQGDNVEARVNSGEMVLTQAQQKALFNMANTGRREDTAGPQIVINNNASNIVDARAQKLDNNRIGIMIDAHINEQLKNGKYNTALSIAQQGQSGSYFGI